MAYKKNRQTTLPDNKKHVYTVGDGVSYGFNGDCYPGTILFVSDSGRQVLVSKDQYQVTDDKGGYVEGKRDCSFTTIQRDKEDCEEWTLYQDGYWRQSPGKGSAWTLTPGRFYASNPSF